MLALTSLQKKHECTRENKINNKVLKNFANKIRKTSLLSDVLELRFYKVQHAFFIVIG